MILLALGIAASAMGMLFLVGCFVRVDSEMFILRASGNQEKISNLRSLQKSWDTIGKMRQFQISSFGFLVFGVTLLIFWRDPSLWRYFWVAPCLFAAHFAALFIFNQQAKKLLASGSHGDTEILKVIKQSMRTCVIAGVIFLVYGVKT